MSRVLLFLTILATCIIFATGCVMLQDAEQVPVQESPAVAPPLVTPLAEPPATPPVKAPASAPAVRYCPERGNESPWIALAPVSDISKGDLLMVRGETNLPAGSGIVVDVIDGTFHPHCKCCFDDRIYASVKVRNSSGCNNSFSVSIDTTYLIPQEYVATATSIDDTDVGGWRIFTLYDNSTMVNHLPPFPPRTLPAPAMFILDPAPGTRRGEMLEISGYTSLPKRAIRYSLRSSPYIRDTRFADPEGLAGGTIYPDLYGDVQQPFTLRFDTADISPGQYLIHAEVLCSDESAEQEVTIVS